MRWSQKLGGGPWQEGSVPQGWAQKRRDPLEAPPSLPDLLSGPGSKETLHLAKTAACQPQRLEPRWLCSAGTAPSAAACSDSGPAQAPSPQSHQAGPTKPGTLAPTRANMLVGTCMQSFIHTLLQEPLLSAAAVHCMQ